VFIRLIFHSNL